MSGGLAGGGQRPRPAPGAARPAGYGERGPLRSRPHFIEFERSAVSPREVDHKLGPYRRMAAAGRPLPLPVGCETGRVEINFRAAGGGLPMLTATQERAWAGPVTGVITVWSRNGEPVTLHCQQQAAAMTA